MKWFPALAAILLWPLAAEPDASAGSSPSTVLVSTGAGKIMTLNPRTGKVYWEADFQPYRGHYYWINTGIAWDKNAVYVADNSGTFSAYSIRQGKRLWQVKLEANVDHAFVAADGADRVYLSGYNAGRLDCFDARTGASRWSANELGTLSADRDSVLVGSVNRNQLVRLDPASGREIWSANGTPWILGRSKDVVYAANWNGSTAALNLRDGTQLWSVARGSWSATVSEDTLVLGGYFHHTSAVDVKSGRELWSLKHERLHAQFVTAIRGDCVFVRDVSQPALHCLDLRTGALRFKIDAKATTSYLNGVSTARGRAFVAGGLDRWVSCVGTTDGRELWKRALRGGVYGVLAVDRTVIAATEDELFGLRMSDGSIAWSFPCKNDGVFYARLLE
jgi:outer membrane protein assembly factor BamB